MSEADVLTNLLENCWRLYGFFPNCVDLWTTILMNNCYLGDTKHINVSAYLFRPSTTIEGSNTGPLTQHGDK